MVNIKGKIFDWTTTAAPFKKEITKDYEGAFVNLKSNLALLYNKRQNLLQVKFWCDWMCKRIDSKWRAMKICRPAQRNVKLLKILNGNHHSCEEIRGLLWTEVGQVLIRWRVETCRRFHHQRHPFPRHVQKTILAHCLQARLGFWEGLLQLLVQA